VGPVLASVASIDQHGSMLRAPTLLSIQSHVAFGHVGNAAAVFPLQRLGCEVWPIHTLQFSNHPGYGGFKGQIFSAQLIDDCMDGLAERGVLPACDGILSGYVGTAEIGRAIAAAVRRVKAFNPRALYCCDPVMGDVGPGLYVRADVPDFMRLEAIPLADIITPNQFELGLLCDSQTQSFDQLKRALSIAHGLGPELILVTSVITQETPDDAIELVASQQDLDGHRLFKVRTPRLALSANGAGDTIAALFLAHYLICGGAREALKNAAASVYSLLYMTAQAGQRELAMVGAQEQFINPAFVFEPENL
jgi:pyridoxine kinase